MAPSNELEYLKSLVAQLNDKIQALEAKAKGPPTPAEQLRTILIGPPGAGMQFLFSHYISIEFRCRQGNTGPQNSRQILRMPFGYWGHAA